MATIEPAILHGYIISWPIINITIDQYTDALTLAMVQMHVAIIATVVYYNYTAEGPFPWPFQ